jgi:CBS domain-containing protein
MNQLSEILDEKGADVLQIEADASVFEAVQRMVREIMSSPLIVVTPQTTIDECMALMTDRRIRHLPVVDGGEVVGVVSIGDLVKFKSKQQSFEIQYLTDYITAR